MRGAFYLALSALFVATAAVARQEGQPPAPPVAPVAPATAANPATTPAARPDEWWQKRHAAMNERVKQGGVELLFIGDSITQGWEGGGAALWRERYAPRKAVNLGISADQTEHVLWRLQNGNLEGIAPKAAVIMIGTNNVGNTGGKHSAEQIADGVKAIVAELATQTPKTKVLLLAIFPRAAPGDPRREKIAAINALLAKQADAERVTFLDVGPKFLSADGTLATDVMPDLLHLSAKGYAIWADAIEGELKRLLGEK
jgi:lysophospholipase L1-like esterase